MSFCCCGGLNRFFRRRLRRSRWIRRGRPWILSIMDSEIHNIPLFSRNFLDLAALAPGVIVRDGQSIFPGKTVGYRAVGISGRSGIGTRVQIDGIDVTDAIGGSTVSNLSSDAVSEFQLSRSSLDISSPMTSSGAVSIISKSGDNEVHGTG